MVSLNLCVLSLSQEYRPRCNNDCVKLCSLYFSSFDQSFCAPPEQVEALCIQFSKQLRTVPRTSYTLIRWLDKLEMLFTCTPPLARCEPLCLWLPSSRTRHRLFSVLFLVSLSNLLCQVFSAERGWQSLNDFMEIIGTDAYDCAQSYERLLRDAKVLSLLEVRIISTLIVTFIPPQSLV